MRVSRGIFGLIRKSDRQSVQRNSVVGEKLQGIGFARRKSSFKVNDINDLQANDLEEEDELFTLNERLNMVKSKYMFFPDNPLKAFWDFIIFFGILYQSLVLPFRIAFQPVMPYWLTQLELYLDCLFIIDIVLNFNSGVYDKGMLVMQRKTVVMLYLKSWFAFDVIATFPYSWIFSWNNKISINVLERDSDQQQVFYKTPQVLRVLKIARALKVLKLIRVLKLSKVFTMFEDHVVTDGMNLLITFFRLWTQIIFIGHWVACFFWYVGLTQLQSDENCWIRDQGIDDSPMIKQYVFSLYWAFTTMITVGYGDITPRNTIERMYTMCAMILASGIFAYTINSIGTLVSRYNILAGHYREMMNYVNKEMISKQIPSELRMKIRRYLEYNYEQKKIVKIDEGEVFALLNENLKEKITVYLNGRILKNMKFFEEFGLDFLSELTFYFKVQTFAIDEFLFLEDDNAEGIFHIQSGRVAMIHKESHTYILDLIKDQYFGELGFFTDNPRTLSAKSRDFTETYVINKTSFLKIAEDYIDAIQCYHTIRSQLLEERNYYSLKIECYICFKRGHLAIGCPFFKNRKGNLIKAYFKFNKQFKEDQGIGNQFGSLSLSYIYEEDDPRKAPNKLKNGNEKQIFSTLEDNRIVKIKTELVRNSYLVNNLQDHQRILEDVMQSDDEHDKHKKIKNMRRQSRRVSRQFDNKLIQNQLSHKLAQINQKNTQRIFQNQFGSLNHDSGMYQASITVSNSTPQSQTTKIIIEEEDQEEDSYEADKEKNSGELQSSNDMKDNDFRREFLQNEDFSIRLQSTKQRKQSKKSLFKKQKEKSASILSTQDQTIFRSKSRLSDEQNNTLSQRFGHYSFNNNNELGMHFLDEEIKQEDVQNSSVATKTFYVQDQIDEQSDDNTSYYSAKENQINRQDNAATSSLHSSIKSFLIQEMIQTQNGSQQLESEEGREIRIDQVQEFTAENLMNSDTMAQQILPQANIVIHNVQSEGQAIIQSSEKISVSPASGPSMHFIMDQGKSQNNNV